MKFYTLQQVQTLLIELLQAVIVDSAANLHTHKPDERQHAMLLFISKYKFKDTRMYLSIILLTLEAQVHALIRYVALLTLDCLITSECINSVRMVQDMSSELSKTNLSSPSLMTLYESFVDKGSVLRKSFPDTIRRLSVNIRRLYENAEGNGKIIPSPFTLVPFVSQTLTEVNEQMNTHIINMANHWPILKHTKKVIDRLENTEFDLNEGLRHRYDANKQRHAVIFNMHFFKGLDVIELRMLLDQIICNATRDTQHTELPEQIDHILDISELLDILP